MKQNKILIPQESVDYILDKPRKTDLHVVSFSNKKNQFSIRFHFLQSQPVFSEDFALL